MSKNVYAFGGGSAEGRVEMRNLLGGKGANLAEMSTLDCGPAGLHHYDGGLFHYTQNGSVYPEGLVDEVNTALAGRGYHRRGCGDPDGPLLVSVRSAARASMPV